MTTTTRLTGSDAIEYAERHGLTLSHYGTPIEDAREGVSTDDESVREMLHADPSLIYLDVEIDGELVLCRSDMGDGGWSLHAPGVGDVEIADGDDLVLLDGPSEWDEEACGWVRPTEADYALASRVLLRSHGVVREARLPAGYYELRRTGGGGDVRDVCPYDNAEYVTDGARYGLRYEDGHVDWLGYTIASAFGEPGTTDTFIHGEG